MDARGLFLSRVSYLLLALAVGAIFLAVFLAPCPAPAAVLAAVGYGPFAGLVHEARSLHFVVAAAYANRSASPPVCGSSSPTGKPEDRQTGLRALQLELFTKP